MGPEHQRAKAVKFRYLPLALLVLPSLALPVAHAKASAEAGAAIAATCGACHGAAGANSNNPEWPNLAGQNAHYIAHQLHMQHDGMRTSKPGDANPMVMVAQASALSEQQIDDVSAYFATLAPAGLEAPAGSFAVGKKLYHWGDRSKGIPACAACHGPVGRGNPAAGYPALRAQQSVYVLKQLNNYAADMRYTLNDKGASMGGELATIMHTISSRLSDDEKASLAAYVQGMR
jgi:cytochrome c553